ncbi:MAG: flagellar basal body-associated FliL family protein [Clostridiales bacterium]|nr:flagellar basal body-associated FliL family protein [Clostridiales bacterium]
MADRMDPNAIKQAPEKKKKKKKLLIIIPLIIVLLAGGFVGYAFFTKSFFFKVDGEAAVVKIDEKIYDMEEFIINLNDEGSRRYLKTKIVLAYENDKDLDLFNKNIPQMRDLIIETLRAKTSEDVMNVENTESLKNEIRDNVNKIYDEDIVLEVYFVDFLIQ